MEVAQAELAEELSALVAASQSLLAKVALLEKSAVIDKAFTREMGSLAGLIYAHSQQAAKIALP